MPRASAPFLAALALSLTACSSTTADTSASTTTTPPPTETLIAMPAATTTASRSIRSEVAAWTGAADPSEVAGLFAQASWAMDTSTDRSPTDAQRRSAAYAMPQLAQELTSGGPIGGGGAQWTQLVAHHGWTTVATSARPAQDAPDTATTKTRQVTTTIIAHGDDGWTSATIYPPQVVFVQLVPAPGGGWKVSRATSAPQ